MQSQGYRPPDQALAYRVQTGTGQRAGGKTQTAQNGRAAAKTSGGGRKPKKRKSCGWRLFKWLLVLLLLAGAAGGLYVWQTQMDVRPYTSVFLDNVSVDGIDLAGMTWEEGSAAVRRQIDDKINSWYVRLKSSAGEYKDITAQTLGISRDPAQALEDAWAVGHDTSETDRKTIFELKAEIDAAKQTTHAFTSAEQSGDTSAIDSILSRLEKAAYVAPQDAVFLGFNPDNTSQPFSFQSEIVGKKLDVESLSGQILSMVETFTTGEVLVQPEDVQPSVTVADLQKNYSLSFRAITPIDTHSTEARNENIAVAFSKINGWKLADGKTLSFN